MKLPEYVEISGKVFRVVRDRRNELGSCEADKPPGEVGEIYICRDLHGRRLIDTFIHELTHAAYPFLAEDPVDRFASDLTKILFDAGIVNPELTRKNHRRTRRWD